MTENNYYAGLDTATENKTGIFETAKGLDFVPDIEKHRIEFQKNPKEYFDTYGEESVKIIPQFLNRELIKNNPDNFVLLYNQLLKEVSFRKNKELQFATLLEVIGCNQSISNGVPKFLVRTELLDKTYKTLNILEMTDECKIIDNIIPER
jgi:hypothetical protein